MMQFKWVGLLSALMAGFVLTTSLALAAAAGLLGPLPQALVDKVRIEARINLHRGKLPNGQFVPRETLGEQASPLLPDTLIRQAVERGRTTAVANLCGLDWVNLSFKPFMAKHRAVKKYSDKQLVYLTALHGVSQGIFEEAFRQQRAVGCSAKFKQQVLTALKN